MPINETKVKKILLEGDYIIKEDLDRAEEFVKNKKISLIEYLFEKNLISKDLLGQALAHDEGLSYIDLRANLPTHRQITKVPEDFAREFRLILSREDENQVIFTTDIPAKAQSLLPKLEKIFSPRQVVLNYSLPEDVDFVISYFYRQPLKTRFIKIIQEGKKVAQEIIAEIFKDALIFNSSDIHFEPQTEEVVVRFRIDGVLQEAGRISREYYSNIINFIKVQSGLRIDEHFTAQDGSMKYFHEGKEVDLRVSILPIIDGEKIVIRILKKYIKGFSLTEIGLEPADQLVIEQEIKRPFGMILTSGPTGAGKTSTLYTIIKMLNNPEINITTLEDPIEYRIEDVNQIQVNQTSNLTFSSGLRSIVRQDPDIIMIGEIRDRETAEISINAALTGHLLLSTFHANDAATTITHLLDIGIEPFLVASTLKLVIAQRLVRRLCSKCRYSFPISELEAKNTFFQINQNFIKKTDSIYKANGCEHCGGTGYKGRVAIFEIIIVTSEIQDLIFQMASAKEIWALAKKQGAHSLLDDGLKKVKMGLTSLEELLRVVTLG
jgi:type IV pilus assembly protein PilB